MTLLGKTQAKDDTDMLVSLHAMATLAGYLGLDMEAEAAIKEDIGKPEKNRGQLTGF